MTPDPADYCGSRIYIADRRARADAVCMSPPGHDDDHGSPSLRWPRLEQSSGNPIPPAEVTPR
jgi:hypothetical protein